MSAVPGARFAGVARVCRLRPVNAGLYFMAGGTAEVARLGATWRCRVMLSVRVVEPVTFGGEASINLAVAEKAR